MDASFVGCYDLEDVFTSIVFSFIHILLIDLNHLIRMFYLYLFSVMFVFETTRCSRCYLFAPNILISSAITGI